MIPQQVNLPGVWYTSKSISPGLDTQDLPGESYLFKSISPGVLYPLESISNHSISKFWQPWFPAYVRAQSDLGLEVEQADVILQAEVVVVLVDDDLVNDNSLTQYDEAELDCS